MLKVVSAAAVIAMTAGFALVGAAHAAPKGGGWGGISVNGTSLKGQIAVSDPVQVVGLVLPNGAAVSIR